MAYRLEGLDPCQAVRETVNRCPVWDLLRDRKQMPQIHGNRCKPRESMEWLETR